MGIEGAVCSAALLAYMIGTPAGALRLAVFAPGRPVSAVTVQMRAAAAQDALLKQMDSPGDCIIYRIYENVPHDRSTDIGMENWAVCRHGIFILRVTVGIVDKFDTFRVVGVT